MHNDEVRIQQVTVNGLTTNYLEAGEPAAAPLLLLHDGAFGSDSQSCWNHLLPLLADQFRVVAPDLLGFGGSAKVFFFDTDPLSQRIEHIAALCTQLGLDCPFVVGASFGGGMVLRGAASRRLPMRAGVSISGPGGLHMIPEQFARLQEFDGTEEAARRIEEMLVAQVNDASVKRRFESAQIPGHWETLSAARLRRPGAPASPDFRPAFRAALGSVEVPIMLIAGADDPLLEPGWARELAAVIPTGRAEEVPDSKHLPQLDRPELVADVLRDFAATTTIQT
jgi:pimeloyl-ACP methyl ester carboxylesterase